MVVQQCLSIITSVLCPSRDHWCPQLHQCQVWWVSGDHCVIPLVAGQHQVDTAQSRVGVRHCQEMGARQDSYQHVTTSNTVKNKQEFRESRNVRQLNPQLCDCALHVGHTYIRKQI